MVGTVGGADDEGKGAQQTEWVKRSKSGIMRSTRRQTGVWCFMTRVDIRVRNGGHVDLDKCALHTVQ